MPVELFFVSLTRGPSNHLAKAESAVPTKESFSAFGLRHPGPDLVYYGELSNKLGNPRS